jgi:hypothetical protein
MASCECACIASRMITIEKWLRMLAPYRSTQLTLLFVYLNFFYTLGRLVIDPPLPLLILIVKNQVAASHLQ